MTLVQTKTFKNLNVSFFTYLQEERFSNVDDVEGTLTFHDVLFYFTWSEETKELTLELNTLPATFSGDEELAWELIAGFITAHGGVEQ